MIDLVKIKRGITMKTILFQGDSITDCGRLRKETPDLISKILKKSPMGRGYPVLISKELAGEYNFVNRGVSGDRILDVYARVVRDIIKIKPDYMSLLVGVNDIWREFDWNNGTGVERYEKVYDILLDELKTELPETKIMILEPFILEGSATSNRDGQPNRYAEFKGGIDRVAQITKSLAEKYNHRFVPLQSAFDEAAKTVKPTELLSDGVHPTELGHQLIKREWLKAFNEIK